MSELKDLPIEKKLSAAYSVLVFTLFMGGLLWWCGVSQNHNTQDHLRVIETQNELAFRNFQF